MMKAKKILMVEDDPILGTSLSAMFKIEGYEVEWSKSAKTAIEKFQETQFDLVSLDIGLPDASGTEVCKEIRKKNIEVPIIFLTAKTDEETIVSGLELGANDFVKKPFSQKELLARVKVLLRSNTWQLTSKIGDLTVYSDSREVYFLDKALELNRRQYDLLIYFIERPDRIITRDQLLNHLGQDGTIYDRTIDSHLSQLRKVLKNSGVESIQISPVYGMGYRLEIK